MNITKKARLGHYIKRCTLNDENPYIAGMFRAKRGDETVHFYIPVGSDIPVFISKQAFKKYWVNPTHSGLPKEKLVRILPTRKINTKLKPSRTKSSKSVLRRLRRILSEENGVNDDTVAVVEHMVKTLIYNRDAMIEYYKKENKRLDDSYRALLKNKH